MVDTSHDMFPGTETPTPDKLEELLSWYDVNPEDPFPWTDERYCR